MSARSDMQRGAARSNRKPLESSMSRSLRLLAQAVSLAGAVAATPAVLAQVAAPDAAVTESYEQRFARAHELATSGRREEAIALYTAMLDASPDNTDLLLGRGRTHAWMGHWDAAEADLQAAAAKSPGYADVWSALGDVYLWSDRPVHAANAYTIWMRLKENDPDAAIARGRAHRNAGNLEAARADFEAAGTLGAEAARVDDLIASLQPRVDDPETVVPAGYRWSLRLAGSQTRFSPDRDNWNEYELSLRRRFERGSLALEWLHADRFNTRDNAWALDAYASLWSRAYANVRYQYGPDGGLFPDHAWRAELFQGVGQGWEVSGSYDHLQFDGSDTDMYGVGVGRYVGNYYLRYRALYVPGVGSGSLSHRGVVRYYYSGDADDYIELNASTGRSHERDTGAFDRVIGESSSSFGVNFVKYVRPQWGYKLGAGYANNVDGFDETRFSAALYARW